MPGFSYQAAVVAALRSNPDLSDVPIYGDAPQLDPARDPAAFPYISCGSIFLRESGAKMSPLFNVTARVYAYSRAGSAGELRDLMRAISASLSREAITAAAAAAGEVSVVWHNEEGSERDRDPDGTREGFIEFFSIIQSPRGE